MCVVSPNDDWQALAHAMVRHQIIARGINDDRVLDAMGRVPRHLFIPHVALDQAYSDQALPTDCGQTISQPYIVALMSVLLDVQPGMTVLEVGGGSGYQAAVLAALGARVVSVELLDALAQPAQAALARAGFAHQVRVVTGDGSLGYSPAAPFHRILVAAAVPGPDAPPPLCEQTRDGGRIVLPLGDRHLHTLTALDRRGDQWRRTHSIACRFVPLRGRFGFPDAAQSEPEQ
jgi:protein-L-isoaspartate(D-aspartate) O-methyltransferase